MTNNSHSKASHIKEPLVRVVRREDITKPKAFLIKFAAIILACLLCLAIIYVLTGSTADTVADAMTSKLFGSTQIERVMKAYSDSPIEGFIRGLLSSKPFWRTIRDSMIMLCVAIALTPAFKMRFWNTGGEGQILMGGLATATVMLFCADKLSPIPLMLAMLAASIAAGLIWGLIPAIFKAKWNTNETLFTLMMNYIAIQLVLFFNIIWDTTGGAGYIGMINKDTRAGWFPTDIMGGLLGSENYVIHLMAILLLTVVVYIYLSYTKHGYEISVVGESENTARYAGISIKKVIIRTMCISGALCGLAGFMLVAGSTHSISSGTSDSRGFTAIIVAWLSKFNPFMMIFYSFLVVCLDSGTGEIATRCQLDVAASDVLTGIVLFFIIASDFFVNYRLVFRHKHHEGEVK